LAFLLAMARRDALQFGERAHVAVRSSQRRATK
jgi:hypothetical protein